MQDQSFIQTSIAAWLTISNAVEAVDFYKRAFSAVETYRLEDPDGGLVVKLSVEGAEFWVSGSSAKKATGNNQFSGSDNFKMILTVPNPDIVFSRSLKAGASEVFPIGEQFGWRLGRLVDPFGLHWEIGHPIS